MSVRPILVMLSIALSVVFCLPATTYAQATPADPTLEPIAADEPIPPAGFPPIPDRLNLSNAIATAPTSTPQVGAGNRSSQVRATYHQGYGHVPAGSYMQRHPTAPQAGVSQDSYNVNTNSANTSSQRATGAPHMPELPAPVTVSQSTTQDLSLPDDEFSDYHQKRRHNSYLGPAAGGMMRGYMFGAAGMAFGRGLGSLRY